MRATAKGLPDAVINELCKLPGAARRPVPGAAVAVAAACPTCPSPSAVAAPGPLGRTGPGGSGGDHDARQTDGAYDPILVGLLLPGGGAR